MRVAVCWKWVSFDRDDDHGDRGHADERWAGVSPADQAALEIGLRLVAADRRSDDGLTVFCLGPRGADDTLRAALAVGADSALRIDASTEIASRDVATALAEQVRGSDLVLCGDYSLDRGTGSVPAYLAAELESAQALGLVAIDEPTPPIRAIRAIRRLDGGRREILDVPLPAVMSVEGSAAALRRASLADSLAVRTTEIAMVSGPRGRLPDVEIHPYRPRPRTLTPPTGDSLSRVRELLDIGGAASHTDPITLDPPEAARRIVSQLVDWGYVDETGA